MTLMINLTSVDLRHHQILHLPQNLWIQDLTSKIHELFPPKYRRFDHNPTTVRPDHGIVISHLARFVWKHTAFCAPSISKNSRNVAPATQSHTPTSPNTAPASRNTAPRWLLIPVTHETSITLHGATEISRQHHQWRWYWSLSHMKRLAPAMRWWFILVTHETSITMRRATCVAPQHHRILHLPQNFEFKIWPQNPWVASAKIKTIRSQSDDNLTRKSTSRTLHFGALTRPISSTHCVWYGNIQRVALRLILRNFMKPEISLTWLILVR